MKKQSRSDERKVVTKRKAPQELKSPVAKSSQRPFIVAAPAYDRRSMGIQVLHTLCNELNRCGRDAYILHYQFRAKGGQDFLTSADGVTGYCPDHTLIKRLPPNSSVEDLRELIDGSYVIYPEVLQGNPLGAKRVVRYILNNPAANGYAMHHDDTDFLVSFHASYWPAPDYLLTILIKDIHFNDLDTQPTLLRQMDCTYIGKGSKFGACFKIPGTVLVERVWPADKESLAVLLRNTRYLFTWDLATQTINDAILCGAIPVILRWAPYSPELFDTEFGRLPYADIRIEDSRLSIALDFESYQDTRLRYLAGYEAKVTGTSDDVAGLATAIEQHFM